MCFRYKTGVFYFGHAETVVPVLAALGLFNDGFPLRAADFGNDFTTNRKFRVSHFSPFSANIALILHEFHGEHGEGEGLTSHPDAERFMLELLINERPLKFPFADRFLWSYSEVHRKYNEYITKCSLKEVCEDQTS
jgi:multiple inositol-polyphosphate phosphatase / 2,3-bisphosphoglycerate 3-phosphatase